MKKTKKVLLILLILLITIIALSFGIYINKQVISIGIGFFLFPIIAYIVYKLKGWDKEDIEIEELRGRVNKSIYKLENEEKPKKQEILNILKGE